MLRYTNDAIRARMDDAKAFAEQHGLGQQLKDQLDYLDKYGSGLSHRTRCTFFYDSAPHSFIVLMEVRDMPGSSEWRKCWEGGFMFHGPADGYGSGAGPTHAVCVNATHGWSVHT